MTHELEDLNMRIRARLDSIRSSTNSHAAAVTRASSPLQTMPPIELATTMPAFSTCTGPQRTVSKGPWYASRSMLLALVACIVAIFLVRWMKKKWSDAHNRRRRRHDRGGRRSPSRLRSSDDNGDDDGDDDGDLTQHRQVRKTPKVQDVEDVCACGELLDHVHEEGDSVAVDTSFDEQGSKDEIAGWVDIKPTGKSLTGVTALPPVTIHKVTKNNVLPQRSFSIDGL
jgi:hypothetical protein